MRMMRACGAGLLTGETGGGGVLGRGVDEAIFVRLVTHCLTTHLPQPADGAKCISYFLVCISCFVFHLCLTTLALVNPVQDIREELSYKLS